MSVNSFEIVSIFFKNTNYSEEARDFLSPFILAGPLVIHEFILERDLSLQLICEARLKFVEYLLDGDFIKNIDSTKKDEMISRLESSRDKLLEAIVLLRKDKIISTFIEEWTFSSGTGWVKLNDENTKRYADDVLTLIGLLKTQPEIFFAL